METTDERQEWGKVGSRSLLREPKIILVFFLFVQFQSFLVDLPYSGSHSIVHIRRD
jgi:hypothetical protein